MNDAMTTESLPSPTTRHSGFTDSLKRQLSSALPKTYYGLSGYQIRDTEIRRSDSASRGVVCRKSS